MRYRLLGRTGLRVSEMFLGALHFGRAQGGSTPEESRRIVAAYADAGGNVIDTASSYADGRSEEIVGEILRGRRDRFVLATKYTWTRDGDDPNAGGNHRKALMLSLEASLRRLGTDHVDVLWAQMWDRRTAIEETMRALDDMVRGGKVLHVGMGAAPAWVVARANALAEGHGWTPFAGVHVPYNLVTRDIERELLPMAEALGLTVATWGPLAPGYLAGRPPRRRGPASEAADEAASVAERQREHAVATAVQAIVDELGITPAQVVLAWIRARSPAIHPVIGPTTTAELDDCLGALDVTLPDAAIDRLDAATGFRRGYPEDFIAEATPWVLGPVVDRIDSR